MDGWALVEGRLLPLAEATVPITDVGFTHGLGVYETLEAGPATDPAPNFERLRESALAIGLDAPDEVILRDEIERVRARIGPSPVSHRVEPLPRSRTPVRAETCMKTGGRDVAHRSASAHDVPRA